LQRATRAHRRPNFGSDDNKKKIIKTEDNKQLISFIVSQHFF